MRFEYINGRKIFRIEFLLLLFGLLIIGFIAMQQTLPTEPLYKPATLAPVSNLNSYNNSKYRYEFNYSKKYRLQNVANFIDMDYEYGLQRTDNQLENSIVYIKTMKNSNINLPTLDYAVNYYKQALSYNNISLPKTSIARSSKVVDYKHYLFINPNGIKGYELYLIEEVTEKNNNQVKAYSRKSHPYFIIEIPNEAKVLLFIQGGDTNEGTNIIRTYINSLRLAN